jgi:hypothetical protein
MKPAWLHIAGAFTAVQFLEAVHDALRIVPKLIAEWGLDPRLVVWETRSIGRFRQLIVRPL